MSGAPRAAILDPWSGGALLAPALRRRGYECLAVHSSPEIASALGVATRAEDFVEVLIHHGDLDETASRLRGYGVGLVLAGCETGVLLADRLAAALGSPGNGLASSRARRDKALMARAAERAGLAVPRQSASGDIEALLAWIDGHAGYPVVVKPPHSLDSDGVTPCASPEEVRAACAALLGTSNRAGLRNEEVIVQELLDGEQYAIDTVSREGRHLLAGIWRYSRPGQRPAAAAQSRGLLEGGEASRLPAYATIGSDGKQMVPADDERSHHLFDFTCRLLDALDIRLGPAHCELMWAGGRPLLIEIGARLHGGEKTPTISRLCTGSSQLDRSLDAWLDPPRFDAALGRPYAMRQHGAMIYLMPWRTGVLRGYGRLRDVTRLHSFVEIWNLAAPGPLTRRVVGLVTLVHSDPEVLRRDVESLRAWESDGLYRIDPD